jgi:hypothetical protein
MISKKQFSMIFSSANDNNPINKTPDGSEFSVILDTPVSFPPDAFDCTIEVVQASIWNSVPNISQNLSNNKFYVYYGVDNTLYTVTFPDGLYSLSSLNSQISKSLINQGIPGDVVSLTGNQSTQSVVLSFPYVGSYVDFTQPQNCRDILGFDNRLTPTTTVENQSEDADSPAKFNNIEYFLLKSDIVQGSIPTNRVSSDTIALVNITSLTGNQTIYTPVNPLRVDASSLKNGGKNIVSFRLTDDKGIAANTGEPYSLTIVFRYSMMIHR